MQTVTTFDPYIMNITYLGGTSLVCFGFMSLYVQRYTQFGHPWNVTYSQVKGQPLVKLYTVIDDLHLKQEQIPDRKSHISRITRSLTSKVSRSLISRVSRSLTSRVSRSLISRVSRSLISRVSRSLISRVSRSLTSRVSRSLTSRVSRSLNTYLRSILKVTYCLYPMVYSSFKTDLIK